MKKWRLVPVAAAIFYFGCAAQSQDLPVDLLQKPGDAKGREQLVVEFGAISVTLPKERFATQPSVRGVIFIQDSENAAHVSIRSVVGDVEAEIQQILSRYSEGYGYSILQKKSATVPLPNHPEERADWDEYWLSIVGHHRYFSFISIRIPPVSYVISVGNFGRFAEHRAEVAALLRSLKIR